MMTTKKKPAARKKSPRGKGERRANTAVSAKLKELWATPEFREKMGQRDRARISAAKLNPGRYSRLGVPDGMRRAEAIPLWAQAEEMADRCIAVLKRNGELPEGNTDGEVVVRDGQTIFVPSTDDGMAEAVLREVFVLALGPTSPQIKTRAIHTVLTYTKPRPPKNTKLMLNDPKAFLDEIAATDD
jgi:hypothetical protein